MTHRSPTPIWRCNVAGACRRDIAHSNTQHNNINWGRTTYKGDTIVPEVPALTIKVPKVVVSCSKQQREQRG